MLQSSADMERFFILDGMALLYRAFYAFINAPMRSSAGMNTSGVYGFLQTVLSVLDKGKPDRLVVCMDPAGKTFRHDLFPEYKANRQAAPEELHASVPWILDLLAAMRIPTVRIDGFEADDLIGTLTRMADDSGSLHSYMVSKDKDLGQLLSPTCSFFMPGNKGDFQSVSQEEFLVKWDISKPGQIIDILALMGDASDNIPGVPSVGEKTARKLIAQFGSLANLLDRTDDVKGKLREKLITYADQARLSYQLATIRRDAPVELSLEDCRRHEFDLPALESLLHQLDFHQMAKKLCGSPHKTSADTSPGELFAQVPTAKETTPASPDRVGSEAPGDAPSQPDLFSTPELKDCSQVPHRYHLVLSAEEREALARRLEEASSWAFDTETTGLDPLTDRLLGVSFCLEEHEAYYVPAADPACLEPFRRAFAGPAEKIGLNVKFDLRVLKAAGISVAGPLYDAYLVHQLLYPEMRHSMDHMAEALLYYRTIRLEDIAGKKIDTAAVPVEQMAEYAAEDADVTFRLARLLKPQLKDSGQEELMRRVEFPLIQVLADMEDEGMRLDPGSLTRYSEQLGVQIDEIHNRIDSELMALVGHTINLNSPRQLGDLLFDELKLLPTPKKTKSGQFATDEETLKKLENRSPIVADVLRYRELAKLKGTYIDALPRFISPHDGRIHATIHQMVAITGRLACQNPNLQNIPIRSESGRFIREAFVARGPEFHIMSADYSQVELRIMAALSGDESMIGAFLRGRDIHAETAARLFRAPVEEVTPAMRRAAKTVNFGLIYGISNFGLAQRLNCSRAEADMLIQSYFSQFPGVKAFMDSLIEKASACGYAETLCGRRRSLPDLKSRNFNLRTAAERNAINTPIQGSAADMIKLAMIRVAQLLKERRSRLIMQIHDELLLELHNDERDELPALVTEAMQQALPLPNGVPLEVEVGIADNWLAAH